MFDSNSIFQQIDEEEEKDFIFTNQTANTPNMFRSKQNDDDHIINNLSKLLDDELDLNKQSSKFSNIENGNNTLTHQFESVDKKSSLIDEMFAKVDNQNTSSGGGLVFPDDDQNSSNSYQDKFTWKSNPVNDVNEFNNHNSLYFPHHNNFKSYEMDYYHHQNWAYNSPYNPPMGFETFGQMNYHNTPYSHQAVDDRYNYLEPEPMQNFNSNGGIFAAFDNPQNVGSYGSHSSSDHGSMKFPSNSNMNSTSHTSNFMAQFQAYPQNSYSGDSRVSWPMALQTPSSGLDFIKPHNEPKYKSGEILKSSFLKQLEVRLEDPGDEVFLSDIFDHIVEVSKDQKGSRFIQDVYWMSSDFDKQQIFEEIKEASKDLMYDKFANYVIQKIFEHGLDIHKDALSLQIKGWMLSLSMDDHACRVIQKMLENVKGPIRLELVSELKENVEKLIHNRNGNHVIQKVIECIPEKHLGFIIEEIDENFYAFCKHKYGCRVIDKLIEFCKSEYVDDILEKQVIDENLQELTTHASGNYVIQSILMHGKTSHKKKVVSYFKINLLKFSTQKYSSNVIECCFKYWSNAQRKELVKELQKTNKSGPSIMEKMLKDRFGNYVIQKMLEKLDKFDRESVVHKIMEICKKEKKLNNSANHVLKIIKERYL